MTENKRYTTDNGSNEDVCLVDNVTGKEFESDFDEIVDLLNEQYALIKRLKTIREEQIQTILKQKRKIKELETELSNMTQRFEYELQMKLKYHSKLIECEKR